MESLRLGSVIAMCLECKAGVIETDLRCIYTVFCHTQRNCASKVILFGLFTGHHQTCTYLSTKRMRYLKIKIVL